MGAGTVVTFYSYKGGVGRTMALANVAVILARWGYRTLCVDWDIEAPGLHLYFESCLAKPTSDGLVELVEAYAAGRRPRWEDYCAEVHVEPDAEPIGLLCAGRADGDYIERMQRLDWDQLFRERQLGRFLDDMRGQWTARYDFVLIDSRTGISDTGGICTIHLPDLLVALCVPNRQSIDGVLEVVSRAQKRRSTLPFDRARLLTLPVVTRLDSRVDYALSRRWLDILADKFKGLYDEWRHRDTEPFELLQWTRLPYVSHWSYGERLAVLEDKEVDPGGLAYSFETLAALTAHRLANSDLLTRSRDAYVAAARRQPGSRGEFLHDVFLSYAAADEEFARELGQALRAKGLSIAPERSSSGTDDDGRASLERTISRSQHFVTIAGATPSRYRDYESKLFLDATYDQSSELSAYPYASNRVVRLLMPILRKDAGPEALPGFLRSIDVLRESDDVQTLADQIDERLAQFGLSAEQVKVRLAARKGLAGANLMGLDLVGRNLSGEDLRGANLVATDLSAANLSGANLRGANLERAILEHANLERADISYANLWHARMAGVRNFSSAVTRSTNFYGVSGLDEPAHGEEERLSLGDYDSFVQHYRKQGMGEAELIDLFRWMGHAEFKRFLA
jgi:cellulose biosynthesis protein BcsQ